MRCSSSEPLLDDYVDGTLATAEHARVAAHLATCDECSALLDELRAVDGLLLAPRALEPAPNFTFKVMADVRTVRRPHPHHRLSFGALAAYVVFAWIAIGGFLFFGGANARAAFVALGAAFASFAHSTGTLVTATGHVFGANTFTVTAAMGALLGVDLALGTVVFFAYGALRARRFVAERNADSC